MPPPSTFRYLNDYSIDLEKSEALATYYAGDQRIPDMDAVDRPDMYRLRQPGSQPSVPANTGNPNNNNNNNNQVPSDPFSSNTPDDNGRSFQARAPSSDEEPAAPTGGPLKPAMWSIQGITDKKLPVRFTAYQTGEITHVAIDNDHWVMDSFVDMSSWSVLLFSFSSVCFLSFVSLFPCLLSSFRSVCSLVGCRLFDG
jgi:hypothetical protein